MNKVILFLFLLSMPLVSAIKIEFTMYPTIHSENIQSVLNPLVGNSTNIQQGFLYNPLTIEEAQGGSIGGGAGCLIEGQSCYNDIDCCKGKCIKNKCSDSTTRIVFEQVKYPVTLLSIAGIITFFIIGRKKKKNKEDKEAEDIIEEAS